MRNIYTYRFLTIILSPLIDLYLFIRKFKGKEDKKRFWERLGYTKIKRPKGKLVWFHGASVGESNSLMPVITEFLKKHKNTAILFTSGTTTSAEVIKKKIKGSKIIHQYVPVDKYFVVKRFLKHWKPNLLLMIESEFWPNMVTMTHKTNCKIIVINGKMTKKSFHKWQKTPKLKKQIFNSIDLCFPQTKENEKRFRKLGVKNIKNLGNLKFDIPTLSFDAKKLKKLKTLINGRKKIWGAISTHKGEEEKIAEIHLNLKKKYPNLLTFIVLRHPKRSVEVCNMLSKNFNLKIAVRSKNQKINKSTDIYLCDTLGEMGLFFKVLEIVLMCGSLLDGIGGHNPVEPAKLNCAIITGRYIANNFSLFDELNKNNACIISNEKTDVLTKEINNLIVNKKQRDELKKNAYLTANSMTNIAKKIVNEIGIIGDL